MTKQRKNEKKAVLAKAITALHKNGEKGPARTTAIHGKKWTYRSNPDSMKRLAEFLKGPEEVKTEKTAGKRILRGAGKASQPAADV